MTLLEKLQELYMQQSKHSNYQVLPRKLREAVNLELFEINSRCEEQRFEFITSTINVKDKSLLDIGGNTGFFSIELLDHGLAQATLYEGNKAHAEFVRISAEILGFAKQLKVVDSYLDVSEVQVADHYDITLLMNVLHHLGDDYQDHALNIREARSLIITSLQKISHITDYLVFQLGYCWKGNRNLLLFDKGTKQEQIDFVKNAAVGHWDVVEIGIPEKISDGIVYNPCSSGNMARQDALGEFLNRPLFILKSTNF